MNILEVYPTPDVLHGTERSMHIGADAVRARGHGVFLLHAMESAPMTAGSYGDQVGAPPLFSNANLTPPGFQQALREVDGFVVRHRIDLIHVHTNPRAAALESWAARYPVVYTVHVPLCPNGARYLWNERACCDLPIGMGCLTNGYLRKGCGRLGNGELWGLPGFAKNVLAVRRLQRTLARCARVIANSEWMLERLIADGLPREVVRAVPAPVMGTPDVEYVPPDPAPQVVAFVGRLVDYKGPDHLLLASRHIAHPHRIWFIGDGVMRPKLEQMSRDLGLADRVQFFGSMPPGRIDELRRRSSVVVVPSLWPEPFGMVGPEAMLMRRPIVAYRVGGIPQWLTHGETGLLVAPGDVGELSHAIEAILQQPALARAMGERGPQAVAQWSAESHGACMLEVYEEALGMFARRQSALVAL